MEAMGRHQAHLGRNEGRMIVERLKEAKIHSSENISPPKESLELADLSQFVFIAYKPATFLVYVYREIRFLHFFYIY